MNYHALTDYDLYDSQKYINSFIPGYVDEEGYIAGSWYVEMDANNNIAGDVAPLYRGDIEVKFGGNNRVEITLDCLDDAGNAITGTITGTI